MERAYVVPTPLVGRHAIVVAYDPLHMGLHPDSAKGRFQILRAQQVVSAGIRRTRRGPGGRVAGVVHLYSDLNREAARLYRRGDVVRAREVAEGAAALEERADVQRLVDLFATSTSWPATRDIEWPPFEALTITADIAALAAAVGTMTEEFRRQFVGLQEMVHSMAGIVRSVQESLAVIETLRGDLLFPLEYLRHLDLDHLGAAVKVELEALEPNQTLVSVSPGLAIQALYSPTRLSPYATSAPPLLPPERWAQLRALQHSPSRELPPLPIPLPAA